MLKGRGNTCLSRSFFLILQTEKVSKENYDV